MDLISSFLKKFSNLTPPQSIFKDSLCKAAKTVLGIDLSPQNVRVERGIAYLDINPLLKAELQLKKTQLLAAANEELKLFGRTIRDLR